MAPYRYSPLNGDEIRLLRLSPRCSGTVRIRIEVKKLSVSDRPKYEALSYVWGPKDSPSEITVKDIGMIKILKHALKTKMSDPSTSNSSHPIRPSSKSRSGAFFREAAQRFRNRFSLSVTASLAQALPYLQLEEEERVLWIDAICINQDNLTERGQQVGRMPDIYKMADRVVIWLGPADQHTQLAIETVDRLAAGIDVNFLSGEIFERSVGSMSRLIYDEATTKSLISLFQRPWFERLWIWQEAHARPDNTVVLVGDYSIMWNTIRKLDISHDRFSSDTPTKLQPLLTQALKLSLSIVPESLISLLQSTTHCKCTDDRDRVFALLGMLDPGDRLDIEPDYAKSATDVFKQVVLQNLATWQRLDVLSYCGLMYKSDGMPSWIPNWSKERKIGVWQGRASPHINAEADYDGKGTLGVLGVGLGVVNSIQAPGLFPRTSYTSEEIWSIFVSRFFSLLPAHEGEGELDCAVEVMMRTLCWNYFAVMMAYGSQIADSFSVTHVKDSLLRWREYLAKERGYPGVCGPPPISAGDWRFQATVQNLAANNSLFRTTAGHLGLGPRLAAQGDKVCVFLGCDSPLLLRLVSDDQWCIVGDCYIHDIVDGSALLSALPDNFQAIEKINSEGSYGMAFRNLLTNNIQIEDPRLPEALPAGWEIMKHQKDSDKQLFGNRELGQLTWADPRLTPDALRARGVQLRTFNLL